MGAVKITDTASRKGWGKTTFSKATVAAVLLIVAVRGAAAQAPDAVPAATGKIRWRIALSGLRDDVLLESAYDRLFDSFSVEKTVEKKGRRITYSGVPLSRIVAMVDGADSGNPFVFDGTLWKAGYSVTLVSKDGYAAAFSTSELDPDALIVAVKENGKPIGPMAVGDSAGSLWVKDLAVIETSLAKNGGPLRAEPFRLELDVNGKQSSYSLEDLERSPFYTEGTGSYTTSDGTKYTNSYGGVKLRDLIELSEKISPADTVRFIAADGYETSRSGSTVLDESDGVWLLAFRMDGEIIPPDPGCVRTVKIGPGNPNVDGHDSVRMVRRVVVRKDGYRDFTLRLTGMMDWTLDRPTVQSGVSRHKRTVNFERKGRVSACAGIPLWLVLAYADDAAYAPHRQDSSITAYDAEAAMRGYGIRITAADGYSITLDSRQVDRNDDVILAMYEGDKILSDGEFPLMLAWDRDAKIVPEGIKGVKMIVSIELLF